MEDRVGGQLMQLNPIDKEKSTKKLVDRGRKTANEMIDKGYPISNAGRRETFLAREDQCFFLQQPQCLEGLQILFGDFGSLPSRNLRRLHRWIGSWCGVLGEFCARWHQRERWGRTKESKSARA